MVRLYELVSGIILLAEVESETNETIKLNSPVRMDDMGGVRPLNMFDYSANLPIEVQKTAIAYSHDCSMLDGHYKEMVKELVKLTPQIKKIDRQKEAEAQQAKDSIIKATAVPPILNRQNSPFIK